MAQDYTVEQLNHGRRVIDFMRWDNVAFSISFLLLVASIAIISVKGFNWGLDFTGGTVIEINLSQPADLDKMHQALKILCYKTLVAVAILWCVCLLLKDRLVKN